MNYLKRRLHLYIPLMFILIGLFGCPARKPVRERPDFSEPIVEYKDGTVTAEEFVRYCSEFESRDLIQALSMSETQWAESFLSGILREKLLADLARGEGLDRTPEMQRWKSDATIREMIENYIKDKIERSVEISEKDLEREYQFNKSSYEIPVTFRFNQIWIDLQKWDRKDAQNRARQALAYLEAGRDPRSVIVEFSDREREERLKPLGDYKKGELPYPALEEAVFETPIGEFSEIVETELGFHIVLPEKINEGRTIPLESVRAEIKEDVYLKKVKERSEEVFNELADEYGAIISLELLNMPESEDRRIILEVGETSMTLGQFRSLLETEKSPEPLKTLKSMAQRMMARQAAEDEGYLSSSELEKDMQLYENRSLAKLYIHERLKEIDEVTEEDIDDYYQNQNAGLYYPREIEPYEIVIKANIRPDMLQYEKIMAMQTANMEALYVREQIMSGMPFPVAAQMYSDSSSRSTGGKLSRRSSGSGRRFDNAAFVLEEGEISEPVELSDGYQLIWVTRIHDSYLPEKEEVREKIIADIENSRMIAREREISKRVLENADMRINESLRKKWQQYILQMATDPLDWVLMLEQ